MFLSASILAAAVSVIPLEGVRCADMTVRADLDAYNVFEGDPIVLTVDFIGNADFGSLHPPELSGAVDSGVWKIDDKSAKTDTYRNARRMTYRIRPVYKTCPSSDWSLQLDSMKLDSLVIAHQPWRGEIGRAHV